MATPPEDVARDVLEVVPTVMRTIRSEMRNYHKMSLSVPQFRTLAFLQRYPGTSLNHLAEHLGLTPATTSKLVDGLVERNFLERRESPVDRRRLTLTLSAKGVSAWDASYRNSQVSFAKRLACINENEREILQASMQILRGLFQNENELEKRSPDADNP